MRIDRWPPPLLQPERHTGCMEHSVAYICRAFGRRDVTTADVIAYRHSTSKIEGLFLESAFSDIRHERFWADYRADKGGDLHKRWWMGPEHRGWVEGRLRAGHIALVHVLRIPTMTHAVVLLDADAENVLLMDPLYGFKEETWDWFLGPGAGTQCHHIDCWYWREGGKS